MSIAKQTKHVPSFDDFTDPCKSVKPIPKSGKTAQNRKLRKKSSCKTKEEVCQINVAKEDEGDLEQELQIPLLKDLPHYTNKYGIEEENIENDLLFKPHINLQYLIVDEICLEGLDGITLDALWIRISMRTKQSLPFSIYIQNYMWEIIKKRKEIEFYKLTEPRGQLVVYNRYENIDPDLGAAIDPHEVPEDIYPYCPVQDKTVLGSAISYESRENITNRVKSLTLDEVEIRYGRELVVVGTQHMRLKALRNSLCDPNVELTSPQYCLLERIGRSRSHGEITQGKISLQTISKDPKIIFYNRKSLLENKLLTKQAFFMKYDITHPVKGTLLHLTRFYNGKKSKTQIMTEQIVEFLRKRPMYRMEYPETRMLFRNVRATMKLLKLQEFQKFVRTDVHRDYRDLYPNATIKEWKVKATDKEKKIRTLELIDPNINVAGVWNEEDIKEESSDEEGVQQLVYNSPLLHQIYDYIKSGGPDGYSLKEIQTQKGIDFYTVRSAVNSLVHSKIIVGVKLDYGRQRTIKYHVLNERRLEDYRESPVGEQRDKESLEFLSHLLQVDSKHLKFAPENSISIVANDKLPCSSSGYHEIIRNLREQNRKCKADVKEKCTAYKSKDGESLFSQVLSRTEEVEGKQFGCVVHQQIHVLPKSNNFNPIPLETSRNDSDLQRIFKNKHGYYTAKNTLFFIAENSTNTDSIYTDIFHSKHSNLASNVMNKGRKKIHKRLVTTITVIAEKSWEENKGLICPLKFELHETRHRKLCHKVFKIVQPILSHFKYKIKLLQPKKGYLCRRKYWKDEFVKFSGNHPSLSNAPDDDGTKYVSKFSHLESSSSLGKRKGECIDKENTKRLKLIEINERPLWLNIYMGPKPKLLHQMIDEDKFEITMLLSSNPEEFDDTSYQYIKDNNMTLRTLKRASCIMKAVRNEKIITNITSLNKMIEMQEKEEGYNVKIDKKSIDRIYTRLVKGGNIKILHIILQFEDVKRIMPVIFDPSVDIRHSMFDSLVDQMKMRFFSLSKKEHTVEVAKEDQNRNEKTLFDRADITDSIGELKLLSSSTNSYVYNRQIGREYGNVPKFMKMRILHEFLFYLIYDYRPQQQQPETAMISEMLRDSDCGIQEDAVKELPPIYCMEVGWKMFIPPLPVHKEWQKGWTLVCDVLLRLPLSIFVKLCNISHIIPELPTYLNHPIKQHYLMKHLPPEVRNGLMHARKYIFSTHETLARLCYIGLLQFGPQKLREKDQLFVYLNRKASLLDTKTSAPGYHYIEDKDYRKLEYYFGTATDVDTYWFDMWDICVHSNLGLRAAVTGTYITIEQVDTKPAMLKAMTPRMAETAAENDDGHVPGDGRGAAGLDSALWAHIRRNWVLSNPTSCKKDEGSETNHESNTKQQGKLENKLAMEQMFKFKNVQINTQLTNQKSNGSPTNSKPSKLRRKEKRYLRKVLPRVEMKTRKEGYDVIDKELMKNLNKTRSDWNQNEDRILQICKIVSIFLCPNSRKQHISYKIIRDVLHKLSPSSRNKTSGACIRRLLVIFGTSDQLNFLQKTVRTLSVIPYVKKYFGKLIDDVIQERVVTERHLNGIFVFLTIHFYQNQQEIHHVLEAIASHYRVEFNFVKTRPTIYSANTNHAENNINESGTLAIFAYENVDVPNERPKAHNKLYSLDSSEAYPNTEKDVTSDTIKSIIHSTIGCRQEEYRWACQMFRVYQNYSDEMLKQALTDIRNSQMVVLKKKYSKKHKDTEGLLILTKLFQFSFDYSFTQITKFPLEIFLEAHEIFLGIAKRYETEPLEGRREDLPLECFLQGHSVGLAEVAIHLEMDFKVYIPKEVLLLDPTITDHTELIRELAVRYKNMLSLVKEGTYFKEVEHVEEEEEQEGGLLSESVDETGFAKRKYISRIPMIQRFLKSWFLGDDAELDQDVDGVNYIEDQPGKDKILMRSDKKRKRPTQITTKESKKILESLNPILCSENQSVSKQRRTTIENVPAKKVQLASSLLDDSDLSFEDYEKRLESLLSTKIDNLSNKPVVIAVDMEESETFDEDIQCGKENSLDFTDSDVNILETYLKSKRQTEQRDSLKQSAVVRDTDGKKVEENDDADVATNTRIQYLMNDELTVEQIMEQMLVECTEEERKVPKATHLARLLVKGLFPDMDDDEDRLERLHQHFLIVCPDTSIELPDILHPDRFHYLYTEQSEICKNLLKKVQMDIIVSDHLSSTYEFVTKIRAMGATESDVQIAEHLLDFVNAQNVLGATVKDLKESFGNLQNIKLSTLLNTLTSMNILIRAGINNVTFVHHNHRKRWLVESCTIDDADALKLKERNEKECANYNIPTSAKCFESYKEIKLRIMPWARIDGTLNLKVFEKWICVILGHCLGDTMIPLLNIISLCQYLKPVDVYYLVECLEELGCIRMVACQTQTITLLSTSAYSDFVCADLMDEFQDIYIQTDNLAVIKMGTLLNRQLKGFEFHSDETKKQGTL